MEPETPKLLVAESKLKAVAGHYIQRSCISRQGKPPAKIGWVISDDPDAAMVLTWLGDSRDKFDIVNGSFYFAIHRLNHSLSLSGKLRYAAGDLWTFLDFQNYDPMYIQYL